MTVCVNAVSGKSDQRYGFSIPERGIREQETEERFNVHKEEKQT